MTYEETLDYLYHAAPLFQNIGAGAYKVGLRAPTGKARPHTRWRRCFKGLAIV